MKDEVNTGLTNFELDQLAEAVADDSNESRPYRWLSKHEGVAYRGISKSMEKCDDYRTLANDYAKKLSITRKIATSVKKKRLLMSKGCHDELRYKMEA